MKDIFGVWLIYIVFSFLQDCSMYCMQVISLLHRAHSSPFYNSLYLFTILFLNKKTRHGRKIVSFPFCLFLSGRAKFTLREQCVGLTVMPCAPVAVGRLSRTVTGSFQRSCKVSECGNKETHNHVSITPYSSLVTVLFTVYAQFQYI
jgi:hypothetical protein